MRIRRAEKSAAEHQLVSLMDVARRLVDEHGWERVTVSRGPGPALTIPDEVQVRRVKILAEAAGVQLVHGWSGWSVTARDAAKMISFVDEAAAAQAERERRDAEQLAAEPPPDRSGLTVGELARFLPPAAAEQALRVGGFGLPALVTAEQQAAVASARRTMGDSLVGMGVALLTDW
jgi:hypothetical protein